MKIVIDFVLNLISQFIGIVLTPVEIIISSSGIDLVKYLDKVWSFITLVSQNLIWVIDALAIPPVLIGVILTFYIFKATLFLTIYGIKAFVKWWGVLW